MNNKVILQLQKLITNNNLTNNDIYGIITYLNRIYLQNLVQENIMKVVNNGMLPEKYKP